MKTFADRTDTAQACGGVKTLHGGKGAGLLNMQLVGLPVPEALILTTEAWKYYNEYKVLPNHVKTEIKQFLEDYPNAMFSVRSGAPVSMPGMMDTVLNVGSTIEMDLITYPGAFRRFATAWLEIVKGIPKSRVKDLFYRVDTRAQGHTERGLKLLTGIIEAAEQISVPTERFDQVCQCVEAVFRSWGTPRAKVYREMHGISEHMGTACVVQRMVMGTAGGLSGSGVMFSRDPATGENVMKGEIAFNAQGEEVVSGEVTPVPLDDLKLAAFEGNEYQDLYDKLAKLCNKLEGHFGDVQDIEFTVESGKLYVLQTRTAKMSAKARIETAVALAKKNFFGDATAKLHYVQQRVDRGMITRTRITTVETAQDPIGYGLPAAPGAIAGRVVFRSTPLSNVDKDCILVAEDTAPEDFPIMAKCGGILTRTGGFTCHSAVVARGIGVPAVVGCNELTFTGDYASMPGTTFSEGSHITIDGTSGAVYFGAHETKKQQPPRSIYQFLHEAIMEKGVKVPDNVYYYDCGIGDRVILPLDPNDIEHAGVQIERAQSLKLKGKKVGFGLELEAMEEDMFTPPVAALFAGLEAAYQTLPAPIMYGVPSGFEKELEILFQTTVNKDKAIQILDLLDLLHTSVPE